MRHRSIHASITLGLVALLTGCSGEPSAADIKSATDAAAARNFGGDINRFYAQTGVQSIEYEKIGCTQDGGGYQCDVRATAHGVNGKVATQVSRARYVKTDAGWALAS